MSSNAFFEAVKSRRSYYQLNKTSPLSDEQITKLAEEALLHVPSSFNSQSTRLVVLLNKEHEQFWDFVLEVLKSIVSAEQLASTEPKIGGFKAAYGTVSERFIACHLCHSNMSGESRPCSCLQDAVTPALHNMMNTPAPQSPTFDSPHHPTIPPSRHPAIRC